MLVPGARPNLYPRGREVANLYRYQWLMGPSQMNQDAIVRRRPRYREAAILIIAVSCGVILFLCFQSLIRGPVGPGARDERIALELKRRGEAKESLDQVRNDEGVAVHDPSVLLCLIRDRQDYRSYHLLMALRAWYPKEYSELPDETRAKILCSSLAESRVMNDWGRVDVSADFTSAQALVELGQVAIPGLLEVMANKTAVRYVSMNALVDEAFAQFHIRICDYAYRYYCLIVGVRPVFHQSSVDRDQMIDAVRRKSLAE